MRGVTQWTAKGAISLLLLYKFQRDVKMEPDGATWSRKGVKMDPNRATWNQKRCQNGSKGAAYNSPGAAYNDRSRLSGRKTHFLTAFCHLSATFLGTLGTQMHPDGPKIESMAAQRAPNDPQRTSKRVDRLDNPAAFNTIEHVHSITQQAPIPLLKMKWLKTK